jgi:anti-sigma factor RsiW
MACDERWLEIVSAWQDGEATPEEIVRARAHLASCVRCRTTQTEIRRLHDAFDPLRNQIPSAPSPRPVRRGGATARVARRRPWVTAGALAAAALMVVVGTVHRHGSAIADELEARHLTAFARASPCEFTSSDPAEVRAWIVANIGYEVEVPTIPGATLLGARRCAVHGGLTASLLYRRGEEPLSLFLPRAGTSIQTESARMSRLSPGCAIGRLGAAVCARPGLFAVAESRGTALEALDSF